jgi:hypothetical protein
VAAIRDEPAVVVKQPKKQNSFQPTETNQILTLQTKQGSHAPLAMPLPLNCWQRRVWKISGLDSTNNRAAANTCQPPKQKALVSR